jgi:hypothetical protein
MVHVPVYCDTQNRFISGLWSAFGTVNTRKRFGNWICFHLQVKEGDTFAVGLPQSLDSPYRINCSYSTLSAYEEGHR